MRPADVEAELQAELRRLLLVTIRRLRERLEDEKEPATPAYLDVARKFLADSLSGPPPLPKASPITVGLPYPAPEPE